MGLHLHRKLTAIIITLFMLTSFQTPVVFAADEDITNVQDNQQTEETAESETKAEAETPAEDTAAEPMEESTLAEDVNAQPSTSQPSIVFEESKESSTKTNQTIEISFTLFGETEDEKWIEETTISLPEKSTVKDAIETILKETNSRCDFNDDGAIHSISFNTDNGTITLTAGDSDDSPKWICRINDKDYENDIDKCIVKNNDKLLVCYVKASEKMNDEETEAEADSVFNDSEEALEFNALVHTTAGETVDNAYGNTRDKAVKTCEAADWSYDSVWFVLGLARAGELTEAQAQAYCNNIINELNRAESNKLDSFQSTYNSRAVLALTAAGIDVSNVGGYNLLEPLSDIDYVKQQGMNGLIWALLAFDSKNYDIPVNQDADKQTTREKLIEELLSIQKIKGGWSFGGTIISDADVDITSMTITALAPYYNTDSRVKTAIDKALNWLSSVQNADGTFSSYGIVNSESISQVIVALTSLGIDPTTDTRFIKNGVNAVDALNSFYANGGGFKHESSNTGANGLASMQGYYALVAYYRNINGKNSLYNMTDAGDDFVIEVDYEKETTDEGDDSSDDPQKNEKTGNPTADPLGATKGITKSAGLIKLKGMTENAKKSIGIIEAVVKRGLSEDASTYTEDDIKAINEAYRMYLDLQPAEKLVVEKDKNWKKFCKLTAALGKIYHIDYDYGVDVLDNNDIIMPWYVRLVVREQDITSDQSKKIGGILGEESQIFGTYDISFTNTLDKNENGEESEWHPTNILKVNMGVPDALDNNPIIIHINDEGKIEFLDNEVINDEESRYEFYDKYVQFQSDDFSVYGIASTSGSIKQMISKTEEEEPSADYLLWVYIGLAALAALALIMILRRRAEQSKETNQ